MEPDAGRGRLMPARKPCLGYRSRSDAVLALTEAGRSVDQIAAMTDIPKGNVSALMTSARRRRRNLPAPFSGPPLSSDPDGVGRSDDG